MSEINTGSQTHLFDYRLPIKGSKFNKLLRSIQKPGVYKGMTLSFSGSTVFIQPGSIFLNCIFNGIDNLGMKIDFDSMITELGVLQSVVGQNEVIYITFEYGEVIDNYANINFTPLSNWIASPDPNGIVLGEIEFSASPPYAITGINYDRKTWGLTNSDAEDTINDEIIYSDTDNTLKRWKVRGENLSATTHILDFQTLTEDDARIPLTNPTNTMIVENKLSIGSSEQSVSKDTGSLVVGGGIGIEKNLHVGGDFVLTGTETINSTTESTSKDTGSLITEGGVGIEKSLFIGLALDVGTTANINSTTQSTSKTTGALIVDGGVGVDKTLTAQDIVSEDSLNVNGTTESTSKTTGAAIIDGGLGVAKRITSNDLTIDNQIIVSGTTESTSISTGSVIIAGGVAIQKRLTVEDITVEDEFIADTIDVTTVNSDTVNVDVTLNVNSTTDSTSTTTGSVIIGGGIGIAKRLNVGQFDGRVPLGAVIPIVGTRSAINNGGTPNTPSGIPVSGVISDDGFQRCDGVAVGSGSILTGFVPDLTDNRFIQGSTSLGTLGGNASNSKTLSVSEMPQHSHGITDPGHSHTVSGDISLSGDTGSGGDHRHLLANNGTASGGLNAEDAIINVDLTTAGDQNYTLQIANAANATVGKSSRPKNSTTLADEVTHTHSLSGTFSISGGSAVATSTGVTINNNGSGNSFDIRPLYMSAIYLMRVR